MQHMQMQLQMKLQMQLPMRVRFFAFFSFSPASARAYFGGRSGRGSCYTGVCTCVKYASRGTCVCAYMHIYIIHIYIHITHLCVLCSGQLANLLIFPPNFHLHIREQNENTFPTRFFKEKVHQTVRSSGKCERIPCYE